MVFSQLYDERVGCTQEGKCCMSSLHVREIRRFTIAEGKPRHRAFPGILRLSSGEILVTFREGSDHWRTDDGVVQIVRSSDRGVSWSEPELLFSEPGWGCSAHHGPNQLSDGRILLPAMSLRHVGERREFKVYLLCSEDQGASWTEPMVLGPTEGWVWQNQYGRVQELPDGRIFILGGGQKVGEESWYSGYFVSHDRGRTFTERVDVAHGLADEIDIARLSDGRLIAMVRDLRKPYMLHRVYSEDEGRTWTIPEESGVFGHCPSFLVLPSGTLLLGHRQVDPSRAAGCALSVSTNGGRTWQLVRDLYTAPGGNWDCSYPSMVLLDREHVLCVYYTAFEDGNSNIEGIVFEIVE